MAVALSVVLMALTGAAAAGAAEPAEISGKVTKLPPAADGGRAVQVVAVHLPDGAIVDADRVENARYGIEVPKGVNVLLTQVIPFGEAKTTSVLSAAVKAKAGADLTLKLRAKKRKRRPGGGQGGGRKVAAAARVIAEDGREYPGKSFAFRTFTGATGDWRFANGGIPDMLTTGLFEIPPGCPITQVERRRFDLITAEHALAQAGLIDPETAVEPGHLIPVEVWIEGTLSNEFNPPAPMRYEIRLVEEGTGRVWTTLRGFLGQNFFAEMDALSAELAAAVCAGPVEAVDPPPPVGSPHYSGSISGRYTAEIGGPTPLKIDWAGTAEFTLTNEFSSPPFGSGLPEPGPYARYETSAGSVHATLDATDSDGCTLSGETDIAIATGAPWGFLEAQEVAAPAYRLVILAGPGASIPFTRSGAGPSCSGSGTWPLDPQQAFARTPTPQSSPSSTLVGSATYVPGAGQTETYNWNLSPGP